MDQNYYQENLNTIKQHFHETENLQISNFIPDYCEKDLYLDPSSFDYKTMVERVEEKIKRSWLYHKSFLNIVDIVAKLGTCSRRQVGAVLVRNRRILATGFNGTPPGSPHCNDEICPGRNAPSGSSLSLCAAVHAEENCLLYCAKYGVSAADSDLYCSCEPCDDCMKLLETVGIKQVIYYKPYPTKMSALRKYFKAKSISVDELITEYTTLCNGRVKFSTED